MQHPFECGAKVIDYSGLSKYYNIARSKYCLISAFFFALFSKSFQQSVFLRAGLAPHFKNSSLTHCVLSAW